MLNFWVYIYKKNLGDTSKTTPRRRFRGEFIRPNHNIIQQGYMEMVPLNPDSEFWL